MSNVKLKLKKEGVSVSEDVETKFLGWTTVDSDVFPYNKIPADVLENLGIERIAIDINDRSEITEVNIEFKENKKNPQSELSGRSEPAWKIRIRENIDKPGYTGYKIREHIRSSRKVSFPELCSYLKREGNKNPETNGLVSHTLKILRDDRKEIMQTGRGDERVFEWVGSA